MRAMIQRVSRANVTIGGSEKAAIGHGLLVLLGIADSDGDDDVVWLSGKIGRMRIFADDAGLMNRSLVDVAGEVLVISQFTLFASTQKGNRPSFLAAARPDKAIPLYEKFLQLLQREIGKPVSCGEFGADMQVALVNDGPVSIWVDTRNRE
jgi:D-aminoacyl-tRNA deacylase